MLVAAPAVTEIGLEVRAEGQGAAPYGEYFPG